jgi:hypothetical protein
VGAVSRGSIAIRRCATIGPWSARGVIAWSVTPVSLSPFTSTQFTGQRPR